MEPDERRLDAMVKWPAVCLLVVGVLSFLMLVASFLLSGTMNDYLVKMIEESGEEVPRELLSPTSPLNLAANGFGLLLSIGTILGGWSMLQRSSWPLAVAGAVCAILPCASCCCLSTPFGIWALIVLLRPEVKEAWSTR